MVSFRAPRVQGLLIETRSRMQLYSRLPRRYCLSTLAPPQGRAQVAPVKGVESVFATLRGVEDHLVFFSFLSLIYPPTIVKRCGKAQMFVGKRKFHRCAFC
jgi:hypothetical protein